MAETPERADRADRAETPERPETPTTALQPAAPPSKTPARIGVAPTTLDEGWRLAQMMAKSDLVPKSFRGHPEDVLVAIQLGTEIGFAPMQALQSIAVINGRPSVWGDGFLALIMGSALYRDHDEYYEVDGARVEGLTADALKKDTTAAVCTFWRRGKPEPVTRRFTVGQAKKAQLFDKRDTPWITYPDRMLLMRARSWAGRDCFPDLLRGIRTAEEALDEREIVDAPLVREVKRVSETSLAKDLPGKDDRPTPEGSDQRVGTGGDRLEPPPAVAERVDETTGEILPPLTAADIPFGGR
jgi:hypothetical protein